MVEIRNGNQDTERVAGFVRFNSDLYVGVDRALDADKHFHKALAPSGKFNKTPSKRDVNHRQDRFFAFAINGPHQMWNAA